ncbi:hypothetical protein HYU07_00205 [Candidatus Woesearchaeota archaeon]|nr:hypothetical protein [Candidatus Woesearchaeota archaeon]
MLKSRNLNRKAVIEVQFNWIFVLIAGSLILLFFIAIVNWQRGLAETNLAKDVRNNLRTIIMHSKLGTEESRENLIRTPNKRINFVCEEATSSFNIEKTGVSESLATTVLFSPDYIKGREMVTYTMKWKSPFFIMNFLYITSPEVRYILVKDATTEDKAKEFYDMLPEKISKEIIDISKLTVESDDKLEDKNNYEIKFIFFNAATGTIDITNAPSFFDKMKNQITAVSINDDEVKFYEYDANSKYFRVQPGNALPFLEVPSLIGAVFAEDAENYKCNMEKAFRKYKIMAELYKNRNELIGADATHCSYYTTTALDDMISKLDGGFGSADTSVMNAINADATALIRQSLDAESNSCPLIY